MFPPLSFSFSCPLVYLCFHTMPIKLEQYHKPCCSDLLPSTNAPCSSPLTSFLHSPLPPSLPPFIPTCGASCCLSSRTVLWHLWPIKGGEEARKCPFDAIHDTESFVAANDDIIAVVFRGTKTIDNWYTNFMLSPRKCPSEWGVPSPGGEVHQVGHCDGRHRGFPKPLRFDCLAISYR